MNRAAAAFALGLAGLCLVAAAAAARPPQVTFYLAGDNAYSPKVPGHKAAPGYDLASGLGVPRFDQLASALPPPAP